MNQPARPAAAGRPLHLSPVQSSRSGSARLLMALLVIGLPLLAACGKEETNPPPALTYANGDSIAELTALPSFSPNPVATSGTLTINLPVDSDTRHAYVHIAPYNAEMITVSAEQAFTGPGTVAITYSGLHIQPAGTYWVKIGLVDQAPPAAANLTQYVPLNEGHTYNKVLNYNAPGNGPYYSFDTKVGVPTFDSQ